MGLEANARIGFVLCVFSKPKFFKIQLIFSQEFINNTLGVGGAKVVNIHRLFPGGRADPTSSRVFRGIRPLT